MTTHVENEAGSAPRVPAARVLREPDVRQWKRRIEVVTWLGLVLVSTMALALTVRGPRLRTKGEMAQAGLRGAGHRLLTDGLGDPLPRGAVARLGTTRMRHAQTIGALAISPDGKWVASNSNDPNVLVWDLQTGECVRQLQKRQWAFSQLAFSPDGKRLVAGTWDGEIQPWEVNGWKTLTALSGHKEPFLQSVRRELSGMLQVGNVPYQGWVSGLVFGPNSEQIISTGGEGSIRWWDMTSREMTESSHVYNGVVTALGISHDGQTVAAACADRIRVYDTSTSRRKARIVGVQNVVSLAVSPDGRLVASCENEPLVKLWDVASEQLVRTFVGPAQGPLALSFLPDGRLALGALDGSISIWDLTAGDVPQMTLKMPPAWSSSGRALLAVSHDGTTLAATTGRGICAWELRSGKPIGQLAGHLESVTGLLLPRGTNDVWTAGLDGTLKRWDRSNGELLEDHVDPVLVNAATMSEDETKVVTAGGLCNFGSWEYVATVGWWDIKDGSYETLARGGANWFGTVDVSPDNAWMVVGGSEQTASGTPERGSLEMIDLTRRTVRRLDPESKWVSRVHFAPDGTTFVALVVVGEQGFIEIRRTSDGEVVRRIDSEQYASLGVAFLDQGQKLAVSGVAPWVGIWNTATGELDAKLEINAKGTRHVAVSPDDRWLAATGFSDTLYIWDLTTRALVNQLETGQVEITSLAFAPDQRLLATGGRDTTVLLWDFERLAKGEQAEGETTP
jgi:WD40 repeat protein